MKWSYWIALYTGTHCVARGLRPLTIAAYEASLRQFRGWVDRHLEGKPPDAVSARDVLEYLEHLRRERGNGDSAVNRAVVVLRSFYRAIVAMGHLAPNANPLIGFPTIKAVPRKLPVTLSAEEVGRLLARPGTESMIGLRDRAILALLYGTGIRASECATLCVGQVDLAHGSISVRGKGGHERTIPLNAQVAATLQRYAQARGPGLPGAPFFRSRFGRPLSRAAVYERVRTWGERAHLVKPLCPHRLRHTFASHLVRAGVGLVTIRDLLGHRQITSTQVYLHVTAHDMRAAIDRHPIGHLLGTVDHLLPDVPLQLQRAAGGRGYG
ncbi:MAG TPA: tyrosine-type recombinase/integrase [Burkholderiales bacterium]|nr:tyrosine-type recombinase/integrase [Burkholderiales bacterium]